MHREGHYGTTLLASSILLLFLPLGIAAYAAGIMLLVAPLPDKDHKVASFMQNNIVIGVLPKFIKSRLRNIFRHRGFIHTFLFGALVAFVFGVGVGFPFYLAGVAELSVGITSTVTATPTEMSVFITGCVFASWVIHIFTDALTVGRGHFGVKPWVPFSSRELRFGLVKAANKWANAGLLLLGLLAYGGMFYYRVAELGLLTIYTF